MPPMMRNGKPLKTLPDGAPRRITDGKNAWRKMNEAQRKEILDWISFGNDAPESLQSTRVQGVDCPSHGFSCADAFCKVRDDNEKKGLAA